MRKLIKLKKILQQMGSCLVAYSGGLDSTFLLKIARDVLGKKVLAVTANSATYPKNELIFARRMAKSLGVRHKVINTIEFKNHNFIKNPLNRCYYCKKELFSRLNKIARKEKINFVVDASNITDNADIRPGTKAKKEFKVRSPLAEAGFNKEDIRRESKKLKLSTWDKPSLACLASRIPYGSKIETRILKIIDQAEKYLKSLGFKQVRVRHYDQLCRIEVPKEDLALLANKRKAVIDRFKKLGYNYITLDLEGFRTGSMNEVIK